MPGQMVADGGERVYVDRRTVNRAANKADHAKDWIQWAREAVTIIAAAGAAYMGIRVDLARNQLDIDNLKIQQARIETQVEKIREMNQQGATHGNR